MTTEAALAEFNQLAEECIPPVPSDYAPPVIMRLSAKGKHIHVMLTDDMIEQPELLRETLRSMRDAIWIATEQDTDKWMAKVLEWKRRHGIED